MHWLTKYTNKKCHIHYDIHFIIIIVNVALLAKTIIILMDDAWDFPYFHVTLHVNMINATSSNTRKASIVARPFSCVARGAWSGDETMLLQAHNMGSL